MVAAGLEKYFQYGVFTNRQREGTVLIEIGFFLIGCLPATLLSDRAQKL